MTARVVASKRKPAALLERAVGLLGKSSPDCTATLSGIASSAVPDLGDYCIVDLSRDGSTTQPMAAAHTDPEKNGLLQELLRFPRGGAHGSITSKVLRTGVPELILDIPAALLDATACNERHRALLHSLRPRAEIVVPFGTDERTFGTITTAFCENRRPKKETLATAMRYSSIAARFFDHAKELSARDEKIQTNEQALSLFCLALRETNDHKRTEAGLRFLEETSAALADSLDLETTLQTAVRCAVSFLADWCAIDLVEGGVTKRMAVAHVDPVPPPGASMVAHDTPNHTLLERVGGRGYMVVPLERLDCPIGTITFGSSEGARPFADSDVAIAEKLAQHVSRAIANARRYKEAKDAVKARGELLAAVSHDLKNPLVVVSMQAGLIKKRATGSQDAERIKSQTEAIERAAAQMNGLVKSLLDMSRIEAGRLVLDVKRHDLTGLTREAIALLRPLARRKHVRFVRTRKPVGENAFVMCDGERILQVLANLIGNAIAFSPLRGRVVIGTERVGGEVRVWVADEGPGIPAKDQSCLFTRFWQASRADARGTGLGLSIAKGIVEAHGCRIWVESCAGKGSTFSFTLAGAVAP